LKARLSETGWRIAEKGEGDIPKKAVAGPSGHGSPTLGGESEARSRSVLGSPGQARVFRRDVPEPFECDPDEENPFEVPGNFIS
jgi:hypothetical protein